MFDKLKSLPIKKQFYLFWGFFIVLILIAVILPFIFVLDSLNITHSNSEILNAIDDKNQALEKSISKDVTLCSTLVESNDFINIVSEYIEADEVSRIYSFSEFVNFFSPYWSTSPEISDIAVYVDNIPSTYMSQGSISLYDITNLKNYNWYKNLGDVSNILIYDEGIYRSHKATFDNSVITLVSEIQKNNTRLGYLCIYLDKNILFHSFLQPNENQRVYLIDNNGKIIISYDHLLNNSNISSIAQMQEKSIFRTKLSTGENMTVFKSKHNSQGWSIVEIYSQASLYPTRPYYFLYLFLILIILILATILFSAIETRLIATPIIVLSKKMKSFEKAETEYNNEIKILYDKYNQMIENEYKLRQDIIHHAEAQRDALLKSAIAQINPHFLYNTLNSIGLKAYDMNAYEICSIIGKLGKLCHLSYNISSMTSTLSEEFKMISLYMDLQNECFNNTFTYSFDTDDNTDKLIIPRFILQPIIENSILHGFSETINSKKIKITTYTSDDILTIKIRDNGCGMPASVLQQINDNSYRSIKYGLYNIKERIQLLYGEEYGVSFQSALHQGTTVTLTLPLIKGETNIENV